MLIHRKIADPAEQMRRTLAGLLLLAAVLTLLGVTGIAMIVGGTLHALGL